MAVSEIGSSKDSMILLKFFFTSLIFILIKLGFILISSEFFFAIILSSIFFPSNFPIKVSDIFLFYLNMPLPECYQHLHLKENQF